MGRYRVQNWRVSYRHAMAGEPQNLASESIRAGLATLNEDFGHISALLSEDFVREDRRSLVSTPVANAAQFVETVRSWFTIGAGVPTFSYLEVLAVRGDRCFVVNLRVSFDDNEFTSDMLHVMRCTATIDKLEKMVSFDVDDTSAALAELDRLHSEIEAPAS